MTIKISIITAVFNASDTINSAVDSLHNQSHPNIEHIIIDGKSTDGTVDILKCLINDSTIMISEEDRGIYDALNKGLKISTGEIIGFLHADDLFSYSDALRDVAKIFEDPSVDAVYGNLYYVNRTDEKNIIRKWKSLPFKNTNQLRHGWMPPHPTLYVRRKWYSEIDGFNIKYRISADYFSILRMFSAKQFKAIYLDKFLIKMRVGGLSNRSIKSIIQKTHEDWLVLRDNGFDLHIAAKAILFKNISKIPQFFFSNKF
jgi:glycosyltransferase